MYDTYHTLKKLIPLKELRKIIALRLTDIKGADPLAINVKLQHLKELRNEGLITKNDYLEQKQKLLDSM